MMKIIDTEIYYVIQRRIEGQRDERGDDVWVDYSGKYYGEESGLKAVKEPYAKSQGTFGDNVRLARRKVSTAEELVEAWEVALG